MKTAELSDEKCREILEWICSNVDYLEHGGKDKTDGFWPHGCRDCSHAHAHGCDLNTLHLKDLNLADYIKERMK